MKILLIGESREGKVLEATGEVADFASALSAESVMFIVTSPAAVPRFGGRLYLADTASAGEYDPETHRDLILGICEKEGPDLVAFAHSSYGWDLASRLAVSLGSPLISEVTAVEKGEFVVPACGGKMRRRVRPGPGRTIVTIQSGAFPSRGDGTEGGQASEIIAAAPTLPKRGRISFIGYEDPPSRDVDLSKADIIVTAGRGVGKKENIALVEELAKALGGQVGASRPVIDAGWLPQSRQVGSTGQNVSPKLYVACGVSGAIQHLAGMRRSAFIVAINKDREAPIAEIADVLVVTDVLRFAPLLSTRLRATLGSSAAASPSST